MVLVNEGDDDDDDDDDDDVGAAESTCVRQFRSYLTAQLLTAETVT
jgi:hypothetical protein